MEIFIRGLNLYTLPFSSSTLQKRCQLYELCQQIKNKSYFTPQHSIHDSDQPSDFSLIIKHVM